MRIVFANESTASRRRVFFQLVDATDGITPETGEAGGQPQVSSDGAAWTNTGIGTLTSVGNGRYYADLTQTLVATAGTQIETRYKSANTAECPGDSVQVVAYNPYDSVRLGLSALPNAAAEASGGLITRGNGTGQLSVTSGAVTVGTNNDKTGYSLTQSFPANFASLAITAGGAVTAGTVSDKTGYSLTQSFPANFSSLAITAGGAVTAGTVSDKTGYSLTQAFPTNFSSLAITAGGAVTAGTVSDKTGYSLTTAPPTSADIADAVWDEALSGHLSSGSTGNALNAAGSAGDPWATALPGAYGAGTAGKIVGDNLNATVSSRLASSAITLNSGAVTVGTNNDKTNYSLASASITTSTFAAGAINAAAIASSAITNAKFATGAIDANAIATDAITSAELATSAVNEIVDAVWGANTNTQSSGTTIWPLTSFGANILRSVQGDNYDLTITPNGVSAVVIEVDTSAREAIADQVWDEVTAGHTTAGTYGGRILRATNSNVEVQVTGSNHVSADVHGFQTAVITNTAFAADALAATNFAASVGQEFADALLGRNIAGGSDGGRMVKDALRFLRNRFTLVGDVLTVYAEDDTTVAWTAVVSTDETALPITGSNPAGGAA